jgi:hypothetical protein
MTQKLLVKEVKLLRAQLESVTSERNKLHTQFSVIKDSLWGTEMSDMLPNPPPSKQGSRSSEPSNEKKANVGKTVDVPPAAPATIVKQQKLAQPPVQVPSHRPAVHQPPVHTPNPFDDEDNSTNPFDD